MERPRRLGAVIVAAVSLAALSVYLLTEPAALPPAPQPVADSPLAEWFLRVVGGGAVGADEGAPPALGAAVGAANVALLYLVLGRTGVERSTAAWLTVAFAFGSVHWWTAAAGTAASLGQLLAVLLTLLGLLLALAGRWPLIGGVLLGLAATTRLPVLLTLPVFGALYAGQPQPTEAGRVASAARNRWLRGLVALAPLAVGVLMSVLYIGLPAGGQYSLDNVPVHAHAALLRSFDFTAEAPWLRPNWASTSLLLTTPLYLWLAGARSRAPVVVWSWLAIALIGAVTVLEPSVGSPQFGYQPSLAMAPLLFLLLGWVFRNGITGAGRAAVTLSVAVNTYGMIAVGVLDPPFAAW